MAPFCVYLNLTHVLSHSATMAGWQGPFVTVQTNPKCPNKILPCQWSCSLFQFQELLQLLFLNSNSITRSNYNFKLSFQSKFKQPRLLPWEFDTGPSFFFWQNSLRLLQNRIENGLYIFEVFKAAWFCKTINTKLGRSYIFKY